MDVEIRVTKVSNAERWKCAVHFYGPVAGRRQLLDAHGGMFDSAEAAQAQADQCRSACETLGIGVRDAVVA